MTNRYLGPAVLAGLARGLAPGAAIAAALVGDAGAGMRQLHCTDALGRSAAWTGRNCVEWCGDAPDAGFSVAGNMLANAAVVADTAAVFRANAALPLPERLMLAMEAGQDAGGDRRGRQSAAMVMITTEDFPDLDIRVDDHPEPIEELRRLLGLWRQYRAPGLLDNPRRGNPSGPTDLDAIEARWIALGSPLRFRR
jgi:uncharacterized Ntn-hydrolase superfamily protein